jgi:peptide deformylase
VAVVNDEIRKLLDDMAETMYAAPGIGLAAIQVGAPVRVVVIDLQDEQHPTGVLEFINPEIIEREGEIWYEEGCLSVPGITEEVQRSARVTVKALDRNGQPFELKADGLLAVCCQHEFDHLEGVLFIDRLSRLKRKMALRHYDPDAPQPEHDRPAL